MEYRLWQADESCFRDLTVARHLSVATDVARERRENDVARSEHILLIKGCRHSDINGTFMMFFG